MKSISILLSFLVLSLSFSPLIILGLNNERSEQTECENHCCSGPELPVGEDDSSSKGICNPFECHVCCFAFIPMFPKLEWKLEAIQAEHFTLLVNRLYIHDPMEFWQPPKIA